ncbi:hypothetical protein TRL7639_00422 [Falsiruegeria litorea R37]|uniref:Uncharacterized protein n=1 Tax=Falsiruegeria litorea R37 TaxID=1200284 RepID=A0A1Y5RJV7_9RHOB|nr:hypothetical protein [Falsiruegeria litorea]SLN19257.1 hypothetical protein TRL7639_00422 [Falsiruegeria litorea R37]
MTDIQIFPYFNSVSLEVFPCLEASEGRHAFGGFQGMAYEALEVHDFRVTGELSVGATYIGVGRNEASEQRQTHWMYCTQVSPHPVFGISKNHRIPNVSGPAPFLETSLFVHLEPLRNIVGLNVTPVTHHSISEFRLGEEGELISSAFGTPNIMGVQVHSPFLPPHFLTGARDLVIAAESERTGQVMVMQHLTCLRASAPAIFVQEESS